MEQRYTTQRFLEIRKFYCLPILDANLPITEKECPVYVAGSHYFL
jgi:hypothetical protein